MKLFEITTAALAAATAIGLSGTALAAPAGNLGNGQQTATTDEAVKQVRHRHWHHRHGYYYYAPYYYRPYYRPYYYAPYGYYGGPAFNFGITIR
jgi:hypothetical protein